MWNNIINIIMMRPQRARQASEKLGEMISSEVAEGFLDTLLRVMSLVFLIDKKFCRNIDGFHGRYLFRSQDRRIMVSAVFKDNRLKVSKKEISDTHVTVIFRNAKALMGFILSPKPDIIGSLLRQDITIDGNLNYAYKFIYMARHLQLKTAGKL
jgi:hypothetical protein